MCALAAWLQVQQASLVMTLSRHRGICIGDDFWMLRPVWYLTLAGNGIWKKLLTDCCQFRRSNSSITLKCIFISAFLLHPCRNPAPFLSIRREFCSVCFRPRGILVESVQSLSSPSLCGCLPPTCSSFAEQTRGGTRSEHLTRDPTRPGCLRPGDPIQSVSVCALHWEIMLMTVCYQWIAFCQKSPVYTAHVQITMWKYRVHRIIQIPRWRILSPKATIKHVQILQKLGQTDSVCHTDPWPESTRFIIIIVC